PPQGRHTKMATGGVLLLLLVMLTMTSSSPHDGDILHDACSKACVDWEDWRKKCFDANCKDLQAKGHDWFPCYMSCWLRSRPCLALCADAFWDYYTNCSAPTAKGMSALTIVERNAS
ncbi:hypothetical protein BaRGS_00017906, partial [Batillaria attramentaria]